MLDSNQRIIVTNSKIEAIKFMLKFGGTEVAYMRVHVGCRCRYNTHGGVDDLHAISNTLYRCTEVLLHLIGASVTPTPPMVF